MNGNYIKQGQAGGGDDSNKPQVRAHAAAWHGWCTGTMHVQHMAEVGVSMGYQQHRLHAVAWLRSKPHSLPSNTSKYDTHHDSQPVNAKIILPCCSCWSSALQTCWRRSWAGRCSLRARTGWAGCSTSPRCGAGSKQSHPQPLYSFANDTFAAFESAIRLCHADGTCMFSCAGMVFDGHCLLLPSAACVAFSSCIAHAVLCCGCAVLAADLF